MIKSFKEDKFYVMSGKGEKWSDFDGPFTSPKEAIEFLAQLNGKFASPEMIQSTVVTEFKNNKLNLLKDDKGSPINGSQIYWKNSIILNQELLWPS